MKINYDNQILIEYKTLYIQIENKTKIKKIRIYHLD